MDFFRPCRSRLRPLLDVHGCGLAAPVLHLLLDGFKAKVVGVCHPDSTTTCQSSLCEQETGMSL